MVQISFALAAIVATTNTNDAATTSGPIKLPAWAPDIASISTTSVEDHQAILIATTGKLGAPLSPNDDYTTRCFGLKKVRTDELAADTVITVDYTAVGELVRT